MSMSDPLADMLTRIRNAGMVNFDKVEIPLSNIKVGIAKVLKEEGYIEDYQIDEGRGVQGTLLVKLKYGPNGEKVLSGLKRVSKPGLRMYVKSDNIPDVMSGLGISILSTSQGVVTDQQARKFGVGGEILCEAW